MESVANETNFNVDCGLYVIKFWAPWCGPCKMYNPVIEKLDNEFEHVTFLSIDTDQVPEIAKQYKISSLPTLVLLHNGEEKKRILGMSMIKPLRTLLRDACDIYLGEVEECTEQQPESEMPTG